MMESIQEYRLTILMKIRFAQGDLKRADGW